MDNTTKMLLAEMIFLQNSFGSNYTYVDNGANGVDIVSNQTKTAIANVSNDVIASWNNELSKLLD